MEDAKRFGIQSFCKEMLTVADTLTLALDTVKPEQLQDEVIKGMHQGVKLTQTQLLKVFSAHGVVVIDPLGDKFDPNFHEALFQQPVDGKEAGTVFAVAKVGYKLNDRILRPAAVGVVQE